MNQVGFLIPRTDSLQLILFQIMRAMKRYAFGPLQCSERGRSLSFGQARRNGGWMKQVNILLRNRSAILVSRVQRN